MKFIVNKTGINSLLFIFFIFFIFIYNVVSVASDKVDYTPAVCKTDAEEMVYFAIGKTVFRTHYKEPIFIRGMPIEKRSLLPASPDPSEPEGCPGNPMRGGAFNFAYHYQRVSNHQAMKMYPNSFGLVHIDSEYIAQQGHEKVYLKVKLRDNLCREVTDGLTGCYSGNHQKPSKDWNNKSPDFFKNLSKRTKPLEDWNASAYQAKREFYKAPFDRPYTLSCYPGVRKENKCNAAYRYSEDVGVYYGFGTLSIPISEIIDFDKNLRERIDEMHVKDYAWQ